MALHSLSSSHESTPGVLPSHLLTADEPLGHILTNMATLCIRSIGHRFQNTGLYLSSVHLSQNHCVVSRACISTSQHRDAKKDYKMVIVGGGSGGASVASRFAKKFGQNAIAVVEPHEVGVS